MDHFDILKQLTRGMDDSSLFNSLTTSPIIDDIPSTITLDRHAFKTSKEFDEAVAILRRKTRIHVSGTDIPPPITNFENMFEFFDRLPSNFKRNVNKFGYDALTPIQMQTIPILSLKRNILACAPTGSGKTLAFLVPLIARMSCAKRIRGIQLVVLAPSRELANQLMREAEKLTENLPMRCLAIKKPNKMEERTKKKQFKKYNILISTPQRLVYLLAATDCLDLSNVKYLVLDEADKLFQAGNQSFRDQLGVIVQSCTHPNLKKAMFSATYANDVEQWCKSNIVDLIQVTIGQRNVAVESVDQKLIYAGNEEGKIIGLRNLFFEGMQSPILIFVQTKQRSADLFKELLYDDYMVACIHSDLTQSQRDHVISAFESGKIWVLICTDLVGRGLDFKNVRVVINYDVPDSAVTYIHRIGRTGRAGEKGRAFTFFTDSDIPRMRSIANVVKQSGASVPEYLTRIKKLSKNSERKIFQQSRKADKKLKVKRRRPRKTNA